MSQKSNLIWALQDSGKTRGWQYLDADLHVWAPTQVEVVEVMVMYRHSSKLKILASPLLPWHQFSPMNIFVLG